MKTNNKYLKRIELVVKTNNGQHESFTTVYVDYTIADALVARGKVDVDSVQFVDKPNDNNNYWVSRRAEVSDLIEYLRSIKSEYWRLL